MMNNIIKIETRTKEYNNAIDRITNCVGYKTPAELTIDDLNRYLTETYNAIKSNYPECMNYIFYKIPHSKNPINVLTEGYVLDEECAGIYILPALCEQQKPKAKKNGAVLILNAVNNHLDSWWAGGNGKGYNIKMDLLIFSGKSLEQILSRYV